MEPILSQIWSDLFRADMRLRGLQAASFERGDEPLMERLLALGGRIAGLMSEVTTLREEFPGHEVDEDRVTTIHSESAAGQPAAPAMATDARNEGPAYPRFYREGDKLVKIGWSEKKAEEYRHSCDIEDAIEVASRIAQHDAAGEPVSVSEILPVKDCRGRDMRNHGIYTAIDWLRAEGLLKRHGRQGYSLEAVEGIEVEIRRRWDGLSEPG